MITNAPLPGWHDLWRGLTKRTPFLNDLVAPWCSTGEVAGLLSRSAWSLALIAIWRKRVMTTVPTMWVPDFFCNSSLLAVRASGVQLVFYPVDLNMQPDLVSCRKLAEEKKPDIFLLVHYFGQPAASATAREFCVRHGAWLVEDAAHVLRPSAGVGSSGDFVMYSPHKNLAIPDGAVLVARHNGPSLLGAAGLQPLRAPTTWAQQLFELSGEMRGMVTSCRRHANLWLLKRVLQKLGFGGYRSSGPAFMETLQAASAASHRMIGPVVSPIARRLLIIQVPELGRIARLRQRRQLVWDGIFGDFGDGGSGATVLAADRPIARSWTPYLASYQIGEIHGLKTYEDYRDRGLPVMTWPDLAPEVLRQPEKHSAALHLRHSMLYFPVHQSLSVRDIMAFAAPLESFEKHKFDIDLVWDEVSRDDWDGFVARAGRSNLLQSWAYGNAKALESGWTVRRGVFLNGKDVVAIVQMLQKSLGGVLRISRINRGPLFLKTPNREEVRGVLQLLAGLNTFWHGKILSIAPELYLSGSNLRILQNERFFQFSPNAWESIWVDLAPPTADLRKQLAGKWRTALASAEKIGVTSQVGRDDDMFDWMMARYEELMQMKDFVGAPVTLLRALRKHGRERDRPIVLRAFMGANAVAGICVVPHGGCATYLVGWSSPEGRHLKAMQYLLWQAICYLKNDGFGWFDLGGLNADQTPGVATFKSGVNGARYETVGEYWTW